MPPAPRTALVCGATGLVGRALVEQLLADPACAEVRVLVRRPSGVSHPRLAERVVDFADLDRHADFFAVDCVFWALGSTLRQAGSKERFEAIDLGYLRAVARLAKAAGVRQFLMVSALGADPRAGVFYNRVKGQGEQAVQAMGFASLTIIRPSLLLGPRQESRLGEALAKRLFRYAPRTWRAVEASDVAAALVAAAKRETPGLAVIESRAIPRRAS